MENQTPGLFERIYNPTLGLPQQILWRIIRAARDKDTLGTLFSNEGLIDPALIPAWGMLFDHENDVMPDEATKDIKGMFGGKQTSGFGSELGVSIATDPLTYLTGGLSTIGKGAKAAQGASRLTSVNRAMKASAQAGGRLGQPLTGSMKGGAKNLMPKGKGVYSSVDDLSAQMTSRDLQTFLDKAEGMVVAQPQKYAAMKGGAKAQLKGIADARKGIANLDDLHLDMPVMDLVKKTGHRKLAIGVPGLATLGARIHIPGDHQSWWKLYKHARQRDVMGSPLSLNLAHNFATRHVAGIPWIARGLEIAASPVTQFKGGWAVGAEARTAIKAAKKTYSQDEFKSMSHWLDSAEGGGEISVKVFKKGQVAIMEKFDKAIAGGKSTTEAFMLAMRGTKNKGDTARQMWARLNKMKKGDADKVAFPTSPAEMRGRLEKQLALASSEGEQARVLARNGDYDATLTFLDIEEQSRKLLSSRSGMSDIPGMEALTETTYNLGVMARKNVNRLFKTGTSTQHAQKAMHEFISESARGHDQVAQFAKVLYAGMKKVLKDPEMKGWKAEDLEQVIGSVLEADALHIEIVESLKLSAVNPSNALDVAEGWMDFINRHTQIMTSMEAVMAAKGADNAVMKRIMDGLKGEVFDYLPNSNQRFSRHYDELIEGKNKEFLSWTPEQKKRMGKRRNAHTLSGDKDVGGGTQVGRLATEEITERIAGIESLAMRDLEPQEILEHIDSHPVLKEFRDRYGLTNEEFLSVFNRHGKGKTRRVPRVETPERYPLWKAGRKSWNTDQAQEATSPFGFSVWTDDGGGYFIRPNVVGDKTIKGKRWGWNPDKSYSTMSEAMGDLHKWLDSDVGAKWRKKYGPDLEGLSPAQLKKISTRKDIKVITSELDTLRKEVLGPEDLAILRGKHKRFDERKLPGYGTKVSEKTGDAIDWHRLKEAEKSRAYSLANKLTPKDEAYDVVNTPEVLTKPTLESTKTTEDVFRKRIKEEGILFDGVEGDKELSRWARSAAEASLNLGEVVRWLKIQAKLKLDNPEIPYEMMEDISANMMTMGGRIRELVIDQLPESAGELFNATRNISKNIFNAARESGQYTPGSPIGYVGRFFNRASVQRIERLIGTMNDDNLGQQVLMRLTASNPSRFGRSADSMSIDQLNEVYADLRRRIAGVGKDDTSSKQLTAWFDEVEGIMKQEGLDVKGLKKRLDYNPNRLESDPILNTLSRLANANQEESLERYFERFLRSGKTEDGDILAAGGKVIAVWDDAENPIRAPFKANKFKVRRKAEGLAARTGEGAFKGGKRVTAEGSYEEVTKHVEGGKPTWLIIETEDGAIMKVPVGMDQENGYGLLRLGKPMDNLGDVKPTVSQAFVRASTRSDLERQFTTPSEMMRVAEGQEGNIYDLVGEHVVYGAKNIVLGGVKTAAQTLQVTPASMRTFDNINHMIKSFQTVFRIPFHVANMASGVFQASLAGVTPRNMMAGYADAIRMMHGSTDFVKHHDVMLSLMGIEGFTSKGMHMLPRLDLMQAVRRNGGGVMKSVKYEELKEMGLDQVEDLVLDLGGGQELAMSEFIKVAGDMQLYGTFASSLTRGSRTTADSLVRMKLQHLDPDGLRGRGGKALAGAIEKMGMRPGEIREVSESLNRTATAMGLIREGHSMERAIEITKNAHVPYERLTPFEKDKMKRAFLYYSFPRHYMPWAWSKFAEDPSKLAGLVNTIKQKKLISTDEGRVHIKLGDYRLDAGRLNANLEAAMMVGAFADNFAMPVARNANLMPTSHYPYDPNVLTSQFTDAGMTSFGGLFSILGGGVKLLPQGQRMGMNQPDAWNDARTSIWPVKAALALTRFVGADFAPVSKEEQSPYVSYTPMERVIADSNFGLGVRKVRKDAEVTHAYYQYRSILRKLELKAAATESPHLKQKYIDNARLLAETLRGMQANHKDAFLPDK